VSMRSKNAFQNSKRHEREKKDKLHQSRESN
jgi:hypothetical protein